MLFHSGNNYKTKITRVILSPLLERCAGCPVIWLCARYPCYKAPVTLQLLSHQFNISFPCSACSALPFLFLLLCASVLRLFKSFFCPNSLPY